MGSLPLRRGRGGSPGCRALSGKHILSQKSSITVIPMFCSSLVYVQGEDYIDCAFGCSVGSCVLTLAFMFRFASEKVSPSIPISFSAAIDGKLSKLPQFLYLLFSRTITVAFFIVYMLMWRSYYNLGYLTLVNELRILIAFCVSTLLLVLAGCYSTVIGLAGCFMSGVMCDE